MEIIVRAKKYRINVPTARNPIGLMRAGNRYKIVGISPVENYDKELLQELYDELRTQRRVRDTTIKRYPTVSLSGKHYMVVRRGQHWSCDCYGYGYYGRCRHIDMWQSLEALREG